MRILNQTELREWDLFSMKDQGISSIELMERACEGLLVKLKQYVHIDSPIHLVCGPGNNGGDGFALARLLRHEFYKVSVVNLQFSKSRSKDNEINYNRLSEYSEIILYTVFGLDDMPEIPRDAIIIDAIFGYGLNKPVSGEYAKIIQYLNKSEHKIISIDIPSGLFVDRPPQGSVIIANRTLSFQCPKLSFFMKETIDYIGEWDIIDIGLSEDYRQNSHTEYVDSSLIGQMIKPRQKYSHKGHYGHVWTYCGSHGMYGAALLACRAALLSGAGKLSAAVPSSGFEVFQSSLPEVMVSENKGEHFIQQMSFNPEYTYLVGCGLGTHQDTKMALAQFLHQSTQPIVLDADALNQISQEPELIMHIPPNSIITPHPGEFRRLFGETSDDLERLNLQLSKSRELQIIIVSKGANTKVTCPDGRLYINSTGNPGMAKAGSGDALAGVIVGLLAQKYTPCEAAVIGCYIHGMAGDLASIEKSEYSVLASDIIDNIPLAFKKSMP